MFGVGARPPEPCAQAQGIQGAGVKRKPAPEVKNSDFSTTGVAEVKKSYTGSYLKRVL